MQMQTEGGLLFRGPLCISWCMVQEMWNLSMHNKQKEYTNKRTSKKNRIRPMQQYGVTKRADKNSYQCICK